MNMNHKITPVEVFSGKIWEAEMVKDLLKSAGIQTFLQDEIIGSLYPIVAPGSFGSVKVIVSNLDLEIAKEIVKEYEKGRG